MKKEENGPVRINSISELHRLLGMPKPLHPLVSLLHNTNMVVDPTLLPNTFIFDFYKISYKRTQNKKMRYGQGYYDFEEGGMVFTAPSQVIPVDEADTEYEGYSLVIHPDFIRNHPLGKNIKSFGFFSYDVNEALHLSEKEKNSIMGVLENIQAELNGTIDDFSQDVLVSYIEVLLNYANRFYKRQFITRKAVNHDLLSRMEQLLTEYFDQQETLKSGLISVEYLASKLNLSPRYLSDMLRSLTGQSAQQHIHEKLISKAKEKLSATSLSVAEIAYELGFEHPQSFSKLFRSKANLTPLEFRESFN